MKKPVAMLLLVLCLLVSCAGKGIKKAGGTIENTVTDEYLHIGGLRYDYKLSELGRVTSFDFRLHPYAEGFSNSLEGVELLENVTELEILGANSQVSEEDSWQEISGIDFLPLNYLKKLKRLDIYYLTLNKIPDFGKIPSLEHIKFYKCRILSLDGIEKATQIKKLDIDLENHYFGNLIPLSALTGLEVLSISGSHYVDDEYEKTVFRLADISGMMGLRHLNIGHFRTIDLNGIGNLLNLEYFDSFERANIINVQELAELQNLQEIKSLKIPESITSLDFLVPLTNLKGIRLYGNDNILDISQLKNLINLEWVVLYNFTIQNLQVLDDLPKLERVATYGSKFSPESNNKLKNICVEYEPDGH